MTFNPITNIRPNIIDLKPYTPIVPFDILSQQLGRHPETIIKLDANENPYGPSPLVAQALAEAPYMHIYPDPESRELRQGLADYTGLEPKYLLVGHGADELIDLIMRLFIEPGDTIINCPPTFGMYTFDGAVNAAQILDIWRKPDFSIDIDQVESLFPNLDKPEPNRSHSDSKSPPKKQGFHCLESKPYDAASAKLPKIIFVTSPNNPSGLTLSDEDLKRLLALGTVVVLDEAYIEFSGGGRIEWVKEYPNLIVLRTFSKWAGLAGLRVGYGAFPLDIIEHLRKIKQPYNVSVAGQIAAQVSLTDRNRLLDNVAKLIKEREKLQAVLYEIEWLTPYPSQTNFILCQVKGREAATVKQQLTEQGILVRYYNSPGLTDCIRISIGTSAQMARLKECLKSL